MGYELVTTSPRCYKLSEVVSESVGKSITRCIHYVEYATQVRDELNYISTYYSLRKVERTLVVNHTIRLRNIKFDKVVKKSPRLGATQYYLGEDLHNMLEGCVRDQPV